MRRWAVCLAGGLFLAACGGKGGLVRKGEIEKTIEHDAFQRRYVEVMGIGAADQKMDNVTQKRATSRDAAIVQAQYEMLSLIKGLKLEGGIVVEKAMETDSRLETHVDEAIKGAQVVKTEWTNDDGCVVTLRLEKKRFEKMTGTRLE